MIFCDRTEIAAAKKVKAAVANVAIRQISAVENGGGAGSAHPIELGVRRDVIQDRLLRTREAGNKHGTWVRTGVSRAIFKNGAERIEREGACNLTASMAAHAVGNSDKASFAVEFFVSGGFEITIVILVFRAHIPRIGEVREIDIGAYFHLLREP